MENLNESHVIHLSNSKEYEDEIVVLKEEKLKEEYRTPINQIWECTHGPGTRPDYKSSDTVHIKHIIDKGRMAVGRCDILGIIKPDVLKQVLEQYKQVNNEIDKDELER